MCKKVLFFNFLLAVVFVLALPLNSFAQYSIPDNTKKDLKMEEVDVAPVVKHDTTGLKVNSAAYDNYLRREERKKKNLFIFTNSLTTTQTGYRNWAAGGTNYIGLSVRSVMSHTYTSDNKKFSTLTTWDLKYGMATSEYQTADGDTKKKLAKNEDAILVSNNINYKLHGKVFYDFNTSLSTQFANTYTSLTSEEVKSKFFAPATINIGLGLSYKLDNNRLITVSPVSGNMLFVLDDSLSSKGAYGVEPGRRLLPNVGMNVKVNWLQVLLKDKKTSKPVLTYKLLGEMFYDYKTKPVASLVNNITLSTLKFLTVNFAWTLKYDDRVEPREGCHTHWQFNNVLSVGVAYTFNNRIAK